MSYNWSVYHHCLGSGEFVWNGYAATEVYAIAGRVASFQRDKEKEPATNHPL